MRRSLGGSYGGASGGANGGDMLRTVGKAMRTRLNNFQENLSSNYSPTKKSSSKNNPTSKRTTNSSNTSKHALSLSSSSSHSNNNGGTLSFLAYPTHGYDKTYVNVMDNDDDDDDDGDEDVKSEIESEWECLENYYDPIFGVVPSSNEVQHALLSLQQVLHPQSSQKSSNKELIPSDVDKDVEVETIDSTDTVQRTSSKSSNSDWLEPSMQPYDRKIAETSGWERVYDAFHLLESEPSVQRMVVSLSSDKAVWDAVLNNEAVREIRDSYRNAAEFLPPTSDEKPDLSKKDSNILKWIFDNMKAKLLEVLGNISQFVADMFKPLDHDKEEQLYGFTDKLKSSFLLTVVVLLIVVVARGHMS